ncbi:MAG: tRNA 2-selenouridine(34) synthase MnmH [Gemmataceae bacterium]
MSNTPQTTDRLWEPGAACPYDEVIDVRSPGEFADDHAPGAVNLPVLSDAERAEVGTVYRDNPFAARKVGAALVSANVGRHLRAHFADKGKGYRPLVYCWRGGQRSASLATVLAAVGWRVTVLAGGYVTYRDHVRQKLDELPPRLAFRVVAGATGSGKTRLLHHLAARGGQVLDLEGLAGHRGSILGAVGPQPPQKLFESRLLDALGRLDPARPVWVEAESRRIGDRFVPPAVWAGMTAAEGVEVRVPTAGRVRHLLAEYPHLVADPARLKGLLRGLAGRRGPRQVAAWEELIDAGRWDELVASLLETHYDPGYTASTRENFPNVTGVVELADPTPAGFDRLADELLAAERVVGAA